MGRMTTNSAAPRSQRQSLTSRRTLISKFDDGSHYVSKAKLTVAVSATSICGTLGSGDPIGAATLGCCQVTYTIVLPLLSTSTLLFSSSYNT